MSATEFLISSNFITDMSGGTIRFRKGTLMVPFLSFMETRKLFSVNFINLTLIKTKVPQTMIKIIEYRGKHRLVLTRVLNQFVQQNPNSDLNITPDNFILKRKSWIRLTLTGNEFDVKSLIRSIENAL